MVCYFLLYNKVNQLYIYIYPHISSLLCLPPPTLPIPPLWSQSTELISRCYVTASHQLSILHLIVYICPYIHYHSHFVPAYPSPSPCPQVHSIVGLHLYSCLAPRFFITFFFFQIPYICQHTVFIFLFLTYFTMYDRLQVHPPHYK